MYKYLFFLVLFLRMLKLLVSTVIYKKLMKTKKSMRVGEGTLFQRRVQLSLTNNNLQKNFSGT